MDSHIKESVKHMRLLLENGEWEEMLMLMTREKVMVRSPSHILHQQQIEYCGLWSLKLTTKGRGREGEGKC